MDNLSVCYYEASYAYPWLLRNTARRRTMSTQAVDFSGRSHAHGLSRLPVFAEGPSQAADEVYASLFYCGRCRAHGVSRTVVVATVRSGRRLQSAGMVSLSRSCLSIAGLPAARMFMRALIARWGTKSTPFPSEDAGRSSRELVIPRNCNLLVGVGDEVNPAPVFDAGRSSCELVPGNCRAPWASGLPFIV